MFSTTAQERKILLLLAALFVLGALGMLWL